ncbi:catalase family protein [Aestuariibacter sp. AA17]|uniref:Catalase family protein n=1 Tax=Fluctibacter corallii TaxID=2984329 RepID=A0ABT3A5P5_9ALTE|nr:catalase family protein [Aestuariibacter sp. AA17]MCV2883995.1 catalase family protein [Aestuariibacter sp. AA17]
MKFAKTMTLLGLLIGQTFAVSSATAYESEAGQSHNIDEYIDFSVKSLGMEIDDNEVEQIKKSMRYAQELSKRATAINGLPYRRDAHAKATGCVRATFSVNGDIPERFQHSVFSDPGQEYQAWIRFSNGDMIVQPDGKGDARGMAIKLLGLEGEKIAPELKGATTHDFVMTNVPAFFNRNIYDYTEDMKYLSQLQRTKYFISLFPLRFHPKEFYRAIQTVSPKIDNPLQPQYFSMLPYRLGENELKFSTKACPGMTFELPENKKDADFLTEVMQKQLANGGACFDFMVQEKKSGANMPIDDATVIWSEKKSPFIPIARVNIPPQSFSSPEQMTFCENLSMNPWHGVGQWEPLGSLNRARRVVYNAVSAFRHKMNQVTRFEPVNWCMNKSGECDQHEFIHETKPTWPLPRCFDEHLSPTDDQDVTSQCPEGTWNTKHNES